MKKHLIKPTIIQIITDSKINPDDYPGLVEDLEKLAIDYGREMKIAGGKQLATMVEDMRTGQKQFFNGDKTGLKETKEKEKKVDQAVDIIKNRKI